MYAILQRSLLCLVWGLKPLFALAIAVLVSAGLFLFAPVLQFYTYHDPKMEQEKAYRVVAADAVLPPKKKARPPEAKPRNASPKSDNAPSSPMARSKFAMDLGVGGGSGGGVAMGAASSEQQMVYQEGETDADVQPLRQTTPQYPDEARKANVSGLVRAMLTIDENGNVANVQIVEQPGDYGFEKAIRDAVANWKYKPAEVGGVPVRQKIEQPFQF